MLVEYDSTPLTLADPATATTILTQEILAALAPFTETEGVLHRMAGALIAPEAMVIEPRAQLIRLAMAKSLLRAEKG